LRRPNTLEITIGLVAAIVTLDLYCYYVRELLASLALFSVAFSILALLALTAVFLWWAAEQLANRSGSTSRKVLAFSRRLIAGYARPT
jgi:hypothetical protein